MTVALKLFHGKAHDSLSDRKWTDQIGNLNCSFPVNILIIKIRVKNYNFLCRNCWNLAKDLPYDLVKKYCRKIDHFFVGIGVLHAFN